jgi:hypothetical protein
MNQRRWAALAALLVLVTIAGCGGGSGVAPTPAPVSTPGPAPASDPAVAAADMRILMLGNSHTTANNLPDMLAELLRAGRPGKTVVVMTSGWGFLDEHLRNAATRRLFNSQKWSAVVFQAQQYSQSGTVDYPTTAAVEWVRMARAQQAVPVMFPEWSRRDVTETKLIFDLHVSIAQQQAACVAPIPQAWDLAAVRFPSMTLHASDGNHSAPDGAFLAALILYGTLTGESPLNLPVLATVDVSEQSQTRLRAVADEQLRLTPARQWCPDDVRL